MIRIPHFKIKTRPQQGLWTSLGLVFRAEQMRDAGHPAPWVQGSRFEVSDCTVLAGQLEVGHGELIQPAHDTAANEHRCYKDPS